MSVASDKVKLFTEICYENSSNYKSGRSQPAFPFRSNQNHDIISLTAIMFKKVIMTLDSSKGSGHDCVPVTVSDFRLLS